MASLDYVWTASHNIYNDVLHINHMVNITKVCEFFYFVVYVVIVIVVVSSVFDHSKNRFVWMKWHNY